MRFGNRPLKRLPYGVDERCVELAALFLSDVFATDAQRRELAEDIQKLCEDYCIVLERDKRRAETEPTPAQMQHHEFMGGDATCEDDVA